MSLITTSHTEQISTSRFIARYHPLPLPANMSTLITQLSEKSATHNMYAIRTTEVQRWEDDGEKWGGQKIEKVMKEKQAWGVCVVSR